MKSEIFFATILISNTKLVRYRRCDIFFNYPSNIYETPIDVLNDLLKTWIQLKLSSKVKLPFLYQKAVLKMRGCFVFLFTNLYIF
jgi:hypothetical protein